MAIYRAHSFGGHHLVRESSVEEEVATAVVGGAAAATGWLIGSSISGVRTLARNSGDRRLTRSVDAMIAALEAEDHDRLLILAQEFTQRYPREEFGFHQLANALMATGRYSECLIAVDKTVELGADESGAHFTRSVVYEKIGELGRAIQESTLVAQGSEFRPDGLMIRARCLMKIGDLDQALRDANEAVAVLPSGDTYSVRGHIYSARGELDYCIGDYTRAIQLCPGNPTLLDNRAEVYEKLGRGAAARADRSAAKEMDSQSSIDQQSSGPSLSNGHYPRQNNTVGSTAAPSSSESAATAVLSSIGLVILGIFGLVLFLAGTAAGNAVAIVGLLLLGAAVWWFIWLRRKTRG